MQTRNEELVRTLLQQRDRAQAALRDTEERALSLDKELSKARSDLKSALAEVIQLWPK